jgi:hypothetical protein
MAANEEVRPDRLTNRKIIAPSFFRIRSIKILEKLHKPIEDAVRYRDIDYIGTVGAVEDFESHFLERVGIGVEATWLP